MAKSILFSLFCFISVPLLAQWQKLNGPFGGSVQALESFSGHFYCGTTSGGLFYKNNNSEPWKLLHQFPNSVNTVYEAAGDLWIGTDYETWRVKFNTDRSIREVALISDHLATLGVVAVNERVILATTDGVFSWDDGQVEPASINAGLPNEGLLATAVIEFEDKVYASINGYTFDALEFVNLSGMYYLDDVTQSWVKDSLISSFNRTFFKDGNRLYACTYSGLYYKDVADEHWFLDTNVGEYTFVTDIQRHDGALWLSTQSGEGIFRSTDNGSTWTNATTNSTPESINYLATFDGILYGAGFGLASTENGTDWISSDEGLLSSTITALSGTGTDLLVGTSDTKEAALFGWKRGVWDVKSNGLQNPIVIHDIKSKGSTFFAATGRGIAKSIDNGDSWTLITNGLPDGWAFNQLAILDDLVVAINFVTGVFVSTDGGDSWADANDGLIAGRGGYELYALHAGASSIYVSAGYGLFRFDEELSTWVDLSEGALPIGEKLSILEDGNRLLVTTLYGIYYTDDNGASWNTLSLDGIPNEYLNANSLIKHTDGTYYLICDTFAEEGHRIGRAVYKSSSTDIAWVSMDVNFPQNASPTILFISGDYLYMGTNGKGLYRHGLFELITNTDKSLAYSLQSYPNPATTTATIAFGAPPEHRLVVTDLRGQVVYSLQGIPLSEGRYQTTLDTTTLPVGIYIYYVQAGSFQSESQRLVVIR